MGKKKPTSKYEKAPAALPPTLLWKILRKKPEYIEVILKIRKTAKALGAKIENTLPSYTDHSVEHMDHLWAVAEKVLTHSEIRKFSAGEAFLLGASFYLHDLGMAASVTAAGNEQLKSTPEYGAALKRLSASGRHGESEAKQLASSEATRALHATKALEFATERLPGLDRFLIEDSDFRERWGHRLGQIAQSHHWSLAEIERELGSGDRRPGPDAEMLDLGYVACALRVIDYAHINRDRALTIERALRPAMPPESAIHWDAQADVTGPDRHGDLLVYGCTKPIARIDAWWLFYDMCKGLDAEIRGVHDYIAGRTVSASRFSLAGVKGVEDPSVFGKFVSLPKGIQPIDIRVQPDSMERVVELLGGKQIYGHDSLAPLRELIQNARDAIELRRSLARASGRDLVPGQITVTLAEEEASRILTVSDDGVGMTAATVCKHLVGVGSDFWNSVDFYRDFSGALDGGFRPIGKFGIGFLSVFMLGDTIEVVTESRAAKRVELKLHGVGRRGELRELPPTGDIGTQVKIVLKPDAKLLLDDLLGVVRARAPMLGIPILVKYPIKGQQVSAQIEPGWWKHATEAELISFARDWTSIASQGHVRSGRERDLLAYDSTRDFGTWSIAGWPDGKPQYISETERLISLGGERSFGVVVCSQGIGVSVVRASDIAGITDVGEVPLTVSRNAFAGTSHHSPGWFRIDDEKLLTKLVRDLRPSVVSKADGLHKYGMLPARMGFLRGLASIFGQELLDKLELAWIPITEPPGNLTHRTKAELISILKDHRSVLVAVGIGPGGAFRAALPHVSREHLGQMPVLSTTSDGARVPYEVRIKMEHETPSGVLSGTLDSLRDVSASDYSRWDLVLTSFWLKCIAEAWGEPEKALHDQTWRLHFKDDVLWAVLRRSS